jgi:hypothetical protein
MSTFPSDKSRQDNLQKCFKNERVHAYTKDFFEDVLAQATTKPLLEIGMQTLVEHGCINLQSYHN